MNHNNKSGIVLYKFSNVVGILKYYAPFHTCSSLMNQLSKKSKECWENNLTAFYKALVHQRQKLLYKQEFDEVHVNSICSSSEYSL